MINKIDNFLGFEKLRDGGSLIASFRSKDTCEYWVMFPIAKFDIENPKFSTPALINRTTGVEVDLSIDGARIWLKNLTPHIERWFAKPDVSVDNESVIFNKMVALCEADE